MYELPILEIDDYPNRKQIIQFGGYNDAPVITDGEMRDMQNLSSDMYPQITQRKGRGIYKASMESGVPEANTAMFANPKAILSRRGKLAVIDGAQFYYGEDDQGSPILIDYIGLSESDNKSMVSINNKICIFPDKVWFDIRDESEMGDNEKKWGHLENNVNIYNMDDQELPTIDGTWGRDLAGITRSAEDTVQNLKYKAVTPLSAENEKEDYYFDSIRFMPGDAVTITGFVDHPNNNVTAVLQSVTIDYIGEIENVKFYWVTLGFPPNTFEATCEEEGDPSDESSECITIKRSCPNLSHVMEKDNRLWGTCDEENAIYACKLGDPTNWYYYRESLASNSYAVGVATDGAWTGCCAYGTHLLFFKEDYIHRIYGTKPANYTLNTIEAQSVEEGSARSIVVVNNTVFYKSRLGIMAYAGGVPQLISQNFGIAKYKNVVAGTNGMKLYFSMESCDRAGEWDFLVYDVAKNIWHKEDHTHALDFAYHDGKVIFAEEGKTYLTVIDADVPVVEIDSEIGAIALREDKDIDWLAIFGDFDEYIEDKKIYSRMQLRMKMSVGSRFSVAIMIDGSGFWEEIIHMHSETKRSVYVPIVPRRCDKFRIKIEGRGQCTIESLARKYSMGSEV